GREYTAKKFQGKWQAIDAEMQQGGLFYMFAIRLLPIIPYGIVNFVAGLTSIRFRDYFIGTLLGTVPGILPFVMMGAGLKSLGKGDILPLMVAFTLIALLVGVGTWYRRRRQFPFQ
ncbi:MAG: VTT domain-containing protein, partial [Microcystis sp. LE19-12.2C]|nr:VTT domain-containing protein [Microcystis sp. LE19-12.2C]